MDKSKADSTNKIDVFLKYQDSSQKSFKVDPNSTLQSLIDIAEMVQLMEIQTLSFNGKSLGDKDKSKTLKELNIKDKSKILVMMRLSGG